MKDEEFIKAFEPASILYADPLREDTRRRLTFLLLSSIVTILVFSRVVSFTEAGFLGIKIATTEAGAGALRWVSWAVTFYGLCAFILAYYQDIKIHAATSFASRIQFTLALHAANEEVQDQCNRIVEAGRQRVTLLLEHAETAKAAWEAWRQNPLPETRPADGPPDPLIEESLKQSEGLSTERVKALIGIATTSFRLRRVRALLDLGFPVCLGLYALLSPFIRR
jgi:hypothetical protein